MDKCNEIWDKIKEKLDIKFHSMLIYDEQYTKAIVREFNGAIKTKWWSAKRKRTLHLHILHNYWFCYWFWYYPHVYLEEWKYKIKKTKMTNFIKAELGSEWELESDIELELNSELESDTE